MNAFKSKISVICNQAKNWMLTKKKKNLLKIKLDKRFELYTVSSKIEVMFLPPLFQNHEPSVSHAKLILSANQFVSRITHQF